MIWTDDLLYLMESAPVTIQPLPLDQKNSDANLQNISPRNHNIDWIIVRETTAMQIQEFLDCNGLQQDEEAFFRQWSHPPVWPRVLPFSKSMWSELEHGNLWWLLLHARSCGQTTRACERWRGMQTNHLLTAPTDYLCVSYDQTSLADVELEDCSPW